MNTKNLDTFITVTKYNSINAAADALFISSPALQQQINRLETDIGFKLFERSASGIRLTAAGQTFLDGIIQTLGSVKDGTEAAATFSGNAFTLSVTPETTKITNDINSREAEAPTGELLRLAVKYKRQYDKIRR